MSGCGVSNKILKAGFYETYGFYYVYEPLTRYLQNRMRIQVRQSLQTSFAEKLAYLSMETLEKPEHQTLLNRLKEGGEQCVVSAFFAVLSMVGAP